jgi:hypothetical protein
MTDTTKLNPLIEPLITLAIPALMLMKLSGMEHLGVVQVLLLALAILLVWSMHYVIRRKKLNLFAVPKMFCVLLTSGVGSLLRTQFKPQTEPQTEFAISTG